MARRRVKEEPPFLSTEDARDQPARAARPHHGLPGSMISHVMAAASPGLYDDRRPEAVGDEEGGSREGGGHVGG